MPRQVVEYFDLSYLNGKAVLDNPNKAELAQKVFERLGHTDKVRRVKAVFTLDSNPDCKTPRGYYWSVVLPEMAIGFTDLGNEGVTAEDCHEYVKAELMSDKSGLPKYHPARYISHVDGRKVLAPCSTSAIPDEETFWQFLNDLRKWAAENLYRDIPDPTPARMRGEQTFPI